MKKRRLTRLTSVILALLLLVSCAPKGIGGVSSAPVENETQNTVISDEQANTETNEKAEIKENETVSDNKSDIQKPVSSKPSEKDKTTSRLTVERPVSSNTETSSRSPLLESDFPYYMPKDNPEPISIHRADAATPTPFSYTGSLGGEEIDFKLNTSEVGFNDELYKTVSVIKTYDELKYIQSYDNELRYIQWREKYDKYGAPYDFLPSDLYTSLYDESFFKDKALIELFAGGAHECDIPKVLKNEDQLCIYHKAASVSKSDISSTERIFIEVSKEDLASVKTLAIYYEKF